MIHSFVEGYLRTVEWTSATSYVVLPLKLQYQVSSHREDSTTEFVNIQKTNTSFKLLVAPVHILDVRISISFLKNK